MMNKGIYLFIYSKIMQKNTCMCNDYVCACIRACVRAYAHVCDSQLADWLWLDWD